MKEKSIYKLNGFIGVIMILVLLAGVLSAFRFFVIHASTFSLIVAVYSFWKLFGCDQAGRFLVQCSFYGAEERFTSSD